MNRGKLVFIALGITHGFNLNKMMNFVEESQYWSNEQINDYQLKRLKTIISHAYSNVLFYRNFMKKLGMEPGDFKTTDDLLHFPIIDKNDIMADYPSFLSRDFAKYKPMVRFTGGTTGVPFKYYNDSISWGLGWATKIRTFHWGGYRFGSDTIAVLKGGTMHNKGRFGLRTRLWRYLQNNYNIPIMHLTEDDLRHHARQIVNQKIRFIRGYPSAVYVLAKFFRDNGISHRVEGIFTTAEMLLDYQRVIIEDTFSCKIMDTYGCGEGMAGANQCEEYSGYHTNIETCFMEVLNSSNTSSQHGEEGNVIVTSLQDFAMPFIRYAPGDSAVKRSTACSCGRKLPLLDKIIGRTSDEIKLANGKIINGLSIPFEDLSATISKFQLVQESQDSLVLNIIPNDAYNIENEKEILATLRYIAGTGTNVQINIVNHIDQTSSGKFRYIVSKIRQSEINNQG